MMQRATAAFLAFGFFAAGVAPAAAPAGPFVTTHTGSFNGEELRYRAIVGETVLETGDGVPEASFWSTAYIREDVEDRSERPVVFLFNGGPTTASMWLRLGAFGPRRVVMPADVSAPVTPPYEVTDNHYTVLDVADLVFIDPPGTGYSRLLRGGDRGELHSLAGDSDLVARFIEAWVEDQGREVSPQYVIGESYGTIRAVFVADALRESMPLEGIVLVGQAVNIIETNGRQGNIVGYAINLPALAAIAWYHGLGDYTDEPVEEVIDAAYAFGRGEYLSALAQGHDLSAAEREQIARRLEGFTGVSAGYYLEHRLMMNKVDFRTVLLKDQGRAVAQADGRYTGPTDSGGSPFMSKLAPAVTAVIERNLRERLGVTLTDHYRSRNASAYYYFDWGAPASPFSDYDWPAVIERVMAEQPEFRLMIATGIYDLMTTVGPARYLIARNDIPAERAVLRHYPGGHMFYTNEAALEAFTDDVRAFVTGEQPAPQ